ncbi:MAG: hypothetical protein M3N68_03790 [Actinomycetota bacterium]|nr:hypothetical protein [Actinomycetota bacterium]
MPDELVFAVDASDATAASPVSFAEAGLRERAHLQEWVLENPEILGPGIMIVTFEFDRWVAAGGQSTADRLDVLGLDQAGHLVVAELKRDRAPDSVTMQALNYAAMVSRFSLDTLGEAYASSPQSSDISQQEALTALQEWAPAISDETLGAPRIVLLASEFGPTVTNLALFLYENGIDISLTRVQPYRTADGRHIVTVSRILPVPNAEDFMVRPRSGVHTRGATASASLDNWSWEAYATQLHIPPDRLTVARRIFDVLAQGIEERGLPWAPKFRKGYVAFQRAGGYNVVAVDLMWNKPVRLWIKLPAAPDEIPLEDPYPALPNIWVPNYREWGWHVSTEGDIPDATAVLDLAERFHAPRTNVGAS